MRLPQLHEQVQDEVDLDTIRRKVLRMRVGYRVEEMKKRNERGWKTSICFTLLQ